jgi:tRNA nucleotidyltransferase (CCA-adding enzyme)
MQTFLVGGAVRDTLLDYPIYDRDWVVVGATPEKMLEQGFRPVGKDFPVFIHPDSGEEYALARTERKSGKGYTGFQYHASPDVTLEQDLIRRDLTINAMAMDDHNMVIDPYGGQQDLTAKTLRHVSPAFSEDPLRVLRVARFLARYTSMGFSIAPETMALMQELAAGDELEHLTAERVWQEFQRALSEASPEAFLIALNQCNALTLLFPELCATAHDSQTLTAINKANDTKVRFAILLRSAFAEEATHANLCIKKIKAFCESHRVPNAYRDLALQFCTQADHLCQFSQLDAVERLSLVTDLGLLRRSEHLPLLFQGCSLICDDELTVTEQLPELLKSLQQISPQQLMQQGYKGKALGEAITQAQLQICQQQIEETCE